MSTTATPEYHAARKAYIAEDTFFIEQMMEDTATLGREAQAQYDLLMGVLIKGKGLPATSAAVLLYDRVTPLLNTLERLAKHDVEAQSCIDDAEATAAGDYAEG